MTNIAILQTTADLSASQAVAGIAQLVPTGTVFAFAGTTAPTGWITCDGTAISRTTYAALFAAIGVAHGYGDNSTTFNVPDYRGRFVRGGDAMFGGTAATRDPDRTSRTAANTGGNSGNAVGSVQGDAFQGHGHQGVLGVTGGSAVNPGDYINVQYSNTGSGTTSWTGGQNSHTYFTDTVNSTGRAPQKTSETRPLNAYVNYIIKI